MEDGIASKTVQRVNGKTPLQKHVNLATVIAKLVKEQKINVHLVKITLIFFSKKNVIVNAQNLFMNKKQMANMIVLEIVPTRNMKMIRIENATHVIKIAKHAMELHLIA